MGRGPPNCSRNHVRGGCILLLHSKGLANAFQLRHRIFKLPYGQGCCSRGSPFSSGEALHAKLFDLIATRALCRIYHLAFGASMEIRAACDRKIVLLPGMSLYIALCRLHTAVAKALTCKTSTWSLCWPGASAQKPQVIR